MAQTCKNFYLYALYIGFNVEHLSSYLLFTLLDGLYSIQNLMVTGSLYYPLFLLN